MNSVPGQTKPAVGSAIGLSRPAMAAARLAERGYHMATACQRTAPTRQSDAPGVAADESRLSCVRPEGSVSEGRRELRRQATVRHQRPPPTAATQRRRSAVAAHRPAAMADTPSPGTSQMVTRLLTLDSKTRLGLVLNMVQSFDMVLSLKTLANETQKQFPKLGGFVQILICNIFMYVI